ncbi:hypothetical protein BX265_3733 [Streptomyces sp. TLI_235]|nr:hypothetical protein [Streptomyces sp. TLI_235]PBC78941.1 hypothetical protein BX265_3733 [Streptomyces sp. TLI_235]
MTESITLCADPARYAAAAAAWSPGRPFPVLPGPALDRYRSLFPDGPLPAVAADPREGLVVSVGDGASAAARLLAVATGREHLQVEPEHLLKELAGHPGVLVAVVGLADDLTAAGDWAGASGASVGVLATRDLSSLACLVYRSLTVDAVGEDRMFVASHPMLEESELADADGLDGLGVLRERRLKVVVLRALGKECCAGFPDGIVCGRSDRIDEPLPELPPGYRHMPCMLGEGCHRSDLDEDQRLPAAEIHATVVFTHSCSSVAVGNNVYPSHVALGLGLLEGTAVAVVGAMGVHIVQRGSQGDFEAALAERLPLGRVVERLGERARPINGWLNRFGLLGDPGLVLPWPEATGLRGTGRTASAADIDDEALRRLADLGNTVLPRLERLTWLEPVVDGAAVEGLRAEVRTLAEDLHDPGLPDAVAALESAVAEFQLDATARIAQSIYVSGWNYGGPALDGLREVSQRPARCPECDRDSAAVVTMRHLVHELLTVQTLQCRRCGDIWWTSESGDPTVRLTGPVDVAARRGTVPSLPRRIHNGTGSVLRGGIGHAFAMRKFLGLPPETSAAVTVEPGGTADWTAAIDLVGHHPRPDVHTGVFVAVLNGVYLASASMMRLT